MILMILLFVTLQASTQCSYVFTNPFAVVSYTCSCGCLDNPTYAQASSFTCADCIDWWGWMLIGVGALLIIIAIVCICKWRRRKAAYTYSAPNAGNYNGLQDNLR